MPNRTRTFVRGLPWCCLALLVACGGDDETASATVNTYTVVREDLPITVKENGELLAINETTIRSEVEGQSTIIYLVPEGSRVEKGQKLVELDVSDLVEKRANQEISVEKARNALEQARTQQQILEKELSTKEGTAASQLKIAEMERQRLLGASGGNGGEGRNSDMVHKLEELVTEPADDVEAPPAEAPPVGGEGTNDTADPAAPRAAATIHPQNYAGLVTKVIELLKSDPDDTGALRRGMGEMANKILQQADQIRLATADLKVKEDTYLHSWKLEKSKFITKNELDRDELAYQSQVSKVAIAWNDLELLINYTLERDRIELTQNLANAKLELERVQAANDASRKNSQFDVEAKLKEFDVATERLANLEKQIKNATIHAPTPGLVVYARLENRRGSEGIQEGTQVRERQALIVLPDNSRLQCVIKVQEAQVDKVSVGQFAHISVEALPTEILTGHVTRVAPVADSSNSWMGNDKKVYTTVVELDGSNHDDRLKSRMAAAATITIGTVKDVLTVPIQAVRRDRSVNYVWKRTDKGPVAVQVKVGAHNQEKVEVVDGVTEGEVVYRTPPGGQPDPKFDQPVVPEAPAAPPMKATSGDGSLPTAQNGGGPGNGPGGEGADGMRGDNGGPGGRDGGRRQRPNMKQYNEMTAEELAEARQGLPAMGDRFRAMLDAEQAAKLDQLLTDIGKAIDENRLDDAQALRASMRSLMPQRPPGGGGPGGPGRNGGNGGNGGNGNGGPGGGGRRRNDTGG